MFSIRGRGCLSHYAFQRHLNERLQKKKKNPFEEFEEDKENEIKYEEEWEEEERIGFYPKGRNR